MILNQPDFFARSATLDGAISDTDTQITLSGLSTRFTDAVAAGTAGYEGGTALGPFRLSDDDGFEIIAITGHVSGSTFEVERGIQGTSEEAWADGTAVRAVVTREQLTDRGLVYSQLFKPSSRAFAHDSFDAEDQDANGYILESGQTLTVQQGTARIEDGRLVMDGTGLDIVTLPATSPARMMRALMYTDVAVDSYIGIIQGYTDNDNYVYSGTDANGPAVREVISGALSTVGSTSYNAGANVPVRETYLTMEAGYSRFDRTNILIKGRFVNAEPSYDYSSMQGIGFLSDPGMSVYIENFSAIR